jgi:hypothetical protein
MASDLSLGRWLHLTCRRHRGQISLRLFHYRLTLTAQFSSASRCRLHLRITRHRGTFLLRRRSFRLLITLCHLASPGHSAAASVAVPHRHWGHSVLHFLHDLSMHELFNKLIEWIARIVRYLL